jgi:hypothetical protein
VAAEGGYEGLGEDLVELHGVQGAGVFASFLEGVLRRVHIALHPYKIYLPLSSKFGLITRNRSYFLLPRLMVNINSS